MSNPEDIIRAIAAEQMARIVDDIATSCTSSTTSTSELTLDNLFDAIEEVRTRPLTAAPWFSVFTPGPMLLERPIERPAYGSGYLGVVVPRGLMTLLMTPIDDAPPPLPRLARSPFNLRRFARLMALDRFARLMALDRLRCHGRKPTARERRAVRRARMQRLRRGP